MAASLSLKLSNRNRKGAIKKLPAAVEVLQNASVEDVKVAIAEQARIGDFNRIGLFDPQSRKLFRDRKAVIGSQTAVLSTGELLVQDLGPQVAWRTVFLVEYFGPILIHALILSLRPHIYIPWIYVDTAKTPISQVQWVCFVLYQLHFWKRELETAFLHIFAANTMPAWNIFRNSFYYWSTSGLVCASSIYATWSPFRYPAEARNELTPLDYFGIALFGVCEICNFIVHRHMATLRRPGTTEKGIPNCIGSSLVTCPNYMFECIAWVGVTIVSRDLTVMFGLFFGILYMRSWSRDKERDLRRLFPDKYKKKRYTMIPGLI